MGVAPVKIRFMIILSFEVALVSSMNIIVTKKVNKQVQGKHYNSTINRDYTPVAINSGTRAVIYTCRCSSGRFNL